MPRIPSLQQQSQQVGVQQPPPQQASHGTVPPLGLPQVGPGGIAMQQQPLQQQPPPRQYPYPHQDPQHQHPHQMSTNQTAPVAGELISNDSVESTTLVLYRRKRVTKADVCQVDPWRIFMALRSGLLTECNWALLFDDSTVQFFGMSNLPVDFSLEHFLARCSANKKLGAVRSAGGRC
ncbi:GM26814 [Drosophila sechellia]|uniref:GM26814 n=1 Tax=Drosophila sechellia TaxID=7238 RepID=B4IIZ8_DROSE|nr:GM26814 [Drosophila sechellia]